MVYRANAILPYITTTLFYHNIINISTVLRYYLAFHRNFCVFSHLIHLFFRLFQLFKLASIITNLLKKLLGAIKFFAQKMFHVKLSPEFFDVFNVSRETHTA